MTGFPAYRQTTAAVRALPLLAKRTGVDIDALAEAFDALSAGALSDDQAALLSDAVDRARPEAPAPEAEPSIPVDVLLQKLDLLDKSV